MLDSPKKRFQQTAHAKRVADYVVDPALIAALDAALLQMSWEQGTAKTPDIAAAVHWQLTGAHKLRDVLLTIALVDKPLTKPRSDNLPNEV
jgi:hypothetical protein